MSNLHVPGLGDEVAIVVQVRPGAPCAQLAAVDRLVTLLAARSDVEQVVVTGPGLSAEDALVYRGQ